MPVEVIKGLEGVLALETSISSIDGKKGILKYRGYRIKDLAEHSTFEEVLYLLWFKKLPTKKELTNFTKKLRSERQIDNKVLQIIKTCPRNASGMDVLRTAVSYLAQCDGDLKDNSFEANIRKGIRLAAKFPTVVAAYWRIKQGKNPIIPKSNLGHGENFLYMLTGKLPSKLHARIMELDFILTAEHEINASTFAARVAISTLSDLHSAVVCGISTLKGPLHGGARAEVYKMLEEIKVPKNAEKHVMNKIAKKQRIMGFGHRVYKAMDPRALIYKVELKKLAEEAKNNVWYDISIAIEKTVLRELVEKKGKPIYTNVDFYTAGIYKYLNIPVELSNAVFALGRIAGWTAHALEQYSDNRLIRPRAKYVGTESATYVPIEKR